MAAFCKCKCNFAIPISLHFRGGGTAQIKLVILRNRKAAKLVSVLVKFLAKNRKARYNIFEDFRYCKALALPNL